MRKVNAFCTQASNILSGTRNFKTFDQHMSIMFDQPSQSASVSLTLLSHPPSQFLLSSHFSRGQNTKNPVLRSLLYGNACYAGYLLHSMKRPVYFCLRLQFSQPVYNFLCTTETKFSLMPWKTLHVHVSALKSYN